MNTAERAQFFFEIAKVLKASVPLPRALEIMAREWSQGRFAKHASELGKKLGETVSVADAYAAFSQALPVEVDLVRAGERGGRLAAVFEHLSAYYGRVSAAEKRIRSASLYPLVLAHLVIVLDFLPRWFAGGDEAAVLGVCAKLVGLWLGLLGVVRGFRVVSGWAERSRGWDRWTSALPLFGRVRRGWVLSRFASVFESCLMAGLLMTESLELAATASGSVLLRESAAKAVGLIHSGKNLAEALEASGGFPAGFLASVATAEHAGSLNREMERLAAAQWEEAERAVQALEEWVPRLGYALVSGWIIFRIFSFYSSYFERFNALSSALDGGL